MPSAIWRIAGYVHAGLGKAEAWPSNDGYNAEPDRIPMGTYNGRVMVCQCYTQQVTRMHTTFEFFMDVVNNGYFDDTRMPLTYASGNSTRRFDHQSVS
ncbi:hypothetical protein P7I89_05420 [Pseudomonas aeruginosa]|nr:hypothetical protein P7I89_05420 [Pseudomonas aeruginosa]